MRRLIATLLVCVLLPGCAPYLPRIAPGMSGEAAGKELEKGMPPYMLDSTEFDPATGRFAATVSPMHQPYERSNHILIESKDGVITAVKYLWY